MHLTSAAAWMSYIFAHIVRRDLIREYLPDLKIMHMMDQLQPAIEDKRSDDVDPVNMFTSPSKSSSSAAAVSPNIAFSFGRGPSRFLDTE